MPKRWLWLARTCECLRGNVDRCSGIVFTSFILFAKFLVSQHPSPMKGMNGEIRPAGYSE